MSSHRPLPGRRARPLLPFSWQTWRRCCDASRLGYEASVLGSVYGATRLGPDQELCRQLALAGLADDALTAIRFRGAGIEYGVILPTYRTWKHSRLRGSIREVGLRFVATGRHILIVSPNDVQRQPRLSNAHHIFQKKLVPGWHRRNRPNVSGAVAYDLALAGDPFGRFALRMRGREAFLLFAPTSGVGQLLELCLPEKIQACMLIGFGTERRTTVRILRPADWQRRLAAVSAGTNRCGSRHVLLIGGLPREEPERSLALDAVELAVRRGGNTELVSSTLRRREAGRPFPTPASARELLTMIELAFPGLVDVPAAAKGSAP